MNLNKNDFYYGALLSKLLTSDFAPAILEKEFKKARLYSISNDYGDYSIFTKYVTTPNAERNSEKRWDFLFNPNEVAYLKNIDKQPIIALICGEKKLRGSRIAFLTYSQFRDCIGRDYQTPHRSVKVKHLKGSKYFNIYGTGLDGIKGYIEIRSNIGSRLSDIATATINKQHI